MSWLTDKLTGLIAKRKLPVEALARTLSVERSYMVKIITGDVTPNASLIRRLAKAFDENPSEWASMAEPGGAEALDQSSLPTHFVKVATASDIPEGDMKIVYNDLVAIACVDGEFYAFGNVCPHAGGPIGDGFLDGCIVECPWHAGRWDIKTGKALTLIATADVPLFDVRIVDGDIEIRLKQPS